MAEHSLLLPAFGRAFLETDMVINEQKALDLVRQVERTAAAAIAADRQDAECLAANAVEQLDGMLLLLGVAGVEIGCRSAWERTIAEIQDTQDRLRLAAIIAQIPSPQASRHSNGAGVLR